MRADDWPTPARIIGELLTSQPEAESLLAAAGHRQALGRRLRWALPSGIVASAMALRLLVALHAFAPHPGWPAVGDRSRGDPVA